MRNIVDDWREFLEGDESEDLEQALVNFAFKHAVEPPDYMADRIINKIHTLQKSRNGHQPFSKDDLPILDSSSNWMDWNDLVKDLQPPSDYEEIHIHTIVNTPERELFVAWIKNFAEEDGHIDFEESFLMLEGTCDCTFTDSEGNSKVISMTVGDYYVIPHGQHHNMSVTTREPLKILVQRKAIRA